LRWQESHLVGPSHSSVYGAPGDIPTLALGGGISCERGQPSHGGILDVGIAYVGGTGSDDAEC
jgi:hypothetical protein